MKIAICDVTLRSGGEAGMSFREKLELAKQLDKLNIDVIETGRAVSQGEAIFVRTVSSTVKNCVVSCQTGYTLEECDAAYKAVAGAKRPRLHVIMPTSPVQMEYSCQLKPAQVLERIGQLVSHCAKLCADVEFTAEDASRSEGEFLFKALQAAARAGAGTLTLSDCAGSMLPGEFGAFVEGIRAKEGLENVRLSVHCGDQLGLGAANSLSAFGAGALQLKTAIGGVGANTPLEQLVHVLQLKGPSLGADCAVSTTQIMRASRQLDRIHGAKKANAYAQEEKAPGQTLSSDSDIWTIRRQAEELGYELSEGDMDKVFAKFKELAGRKSVDGRDLEAIIAREAAQAPPAYQLESYVINSGNTIPATARVCLVKNGKALQGLSVGDGPIDAAFCAIEQVLGRRLELDDFQIQSVTEGREAMGDALVKLRREGKLYSGRGLSTDVIEASIRAYVNAVNKMTYEEEQA